MTSEATVAINSFKDFFFSYGIKIIVAFVIFLIAYQLSKYVFKIIEASTRKLKKPLKYPNTMKLLLRSTFLFIASMIVVGMFNINLWPLLTSLGVVGLIVGLALQQPLGNFFSGLMIIVTDAVNEGETLDIGGVSGIIYAIKLNHTVIDTWDGKRVYIPNTTVWSSKVTKFWPKVARRIEMSIGVSYTLSADDLKRAMEIFQRVLDEEPLVYKGDNYSKEANYGPVSNYVIFNGFGDSSINFTLRFWVLRKDYFDAVKNVGIAIYRELNAAGIEIPFNQLDVHVDGKIENVLLNNSKKDIDNS